MKLFWWINEWKEEFLTGMTDGWMKDSMDE